MKSIRHYLLLPLLPLLSACDPYGLDDRDSKMEFYDNEYYTFVQDIVMAAPVAEVFDHYQDIRSDRDASLRYVEGYFGSWFDLYYDYLQLHSYDYCRIDCISPGVYTYKGWGSRRIIQLPDLPRSLKLTRQEEHVFDISLNETDGSDAVWKYGFSMSAHAVVDGDSFMVSGLRVEFVEDGERNIVSTEGTDLVFPMPDGSGRPKCFPVSGTVSFTRGRYVMTVVYDGTMAHVTDNEGYSDTIRNRYYYIANRGQEQI